MIGIVHHVQVVPDAFHLDAWDCHLTVIVTPIEVIRLARFQQPAGVLWDQIITKQQMEWLAAIPYMEELYRRQFGKALPFFSAETREALHASGQAAQNDLLDIKKGGEPAK